MGVASVCGEQEAGVASGWNLWMWLVGVVVRRYIDFLILLIPTPLVSVLFCSSIPTFCSFFLVLYTIFRIAHQVTFILHICFTTCTTIILIIIINAKCAGARP